MGNGFGFLKLNLHGRTEEISIPDLVFENKLWCTEIRFMQKIADLYRTRLQAIRIEYSKEQKDLDEKIRLAEGFLDPLVQSMDILMADIRRQEEEIAYYTKDYPIDRTHQHYYDHLEIKQKMKQTRKTYHRFLNMIKKELGKFMYV
jgi:uncharacterized membrane protein YcgQ (UPF0703/DUF1980 family)